MNDYDELSQIVECKYCKGLAIWGEMIWLNGKCMCPRCYLKEKAKEEEKAKEGSDNHE